MTCGNDVPSWRELTTAREAAALRQQAQRREQPHKPLNEVDRRVAEILAEARQAGALLAEAGFTEIRDIRPGWRVGMRLGGRYVDTVTMREQDCHTQAIRQLADPPPGTPLWLPGAADADVEWAREGEVLDVVRELLSLDNE